jgi:lysine/ornithine N-monooxygenase
MPIERYPKKNGLIISISADAIDGIYRLIFTRRSENGRHNVHTIGLTKFQTHEEARLYAINL